MAKGRSTLQNLISITPPVMSASSGGTPRAIKRYRHDVYRGDIVFSNFIKCSFDRFVTSHSFTTRPGRSDQQGDPYSFPSYFSTQIVSMCDVMQKDASDKQLACITTTPLMAGAMHN